jgi:hypothetical protein
VESFDRPRVFTHKIFARAMTSKARGTGSSMKKEK